MDEQPPAFLRAVDALYDQAGTQWPRFSEEWYWDILFQARKNVYKSTYAEAGKTPSLISDQDCNLSQTPREECELLGLVDEGPINIPGAAVALHSLQGAPHLNGAKGRVLPPSGRGASDQPSTPGRIPVRLASGQVVACKLSNLKSASGKAPMPTIPDTPTPAASIAPRASAASTTARAAAAAASSPRATSTRPAASTPPLEPLTGPLADLVWADIRQGHVPPILSRDTLSGLQEYKIKCSTCGWFGSEYHIALKRTVPYSLTPVRDSVRLECIDCLVRAAHAAGVRPTQKAVEKFVDGRMMGRVEVTSILDGSIFMRWGGGPRGPAWATAQAEYTASGGVGTLPDGGVLY